ncbi:MAG: hypothetical protein ACWA44_02315 [Thiotrichales bacterium]
MSSTTIQQRFLKTELVKWREIHTLQPDNLKLRYNDKAVEESHDKHGIVGVLDVWHDEVEDIIYILDGHGRIEHYHSREDMPDEIYANFYRAKDKEEAILILLEVFNQKLNPIDQQVMVEWMQVEEIPLTEISVQHLNMVEVDEEVSQDDYGDDFDLPDGDREPFQQMTFGLADEQAEYIKQAISEIKKSDEFRYMETLGNENSNGNALYLLVSKAAGL